ncbi:MCE family protein, partial [Mycobacterium colombiense]|uniref:MCE family protein n=1 Tax=Mycobacterium colombiense TaxID=339268 RepID=UPI001E3806F7
MASFATTVGLAFSGKLVSSVPITVTSDRAGLVMDPGAKVKLRGIQVGRVASVALRPGGVSLRLDLDPDQVRFIPANVQAQIRATTIFGAKFVDLIPPAKPERRTISAGSVIPSRNVTTEVNTVFENLTSVLAQVEPTKINAVLTTLADALRGKGERLGTATTAALDVVTALNDRSDTLRRDLEAAATVTDTYGAASQDLISALSATTTTSSTITRQAKDLDEALLAAIGLADTGIDLFGRTQSDFVAANTKLPATTDLLNEYHPSYTCLLQGLDWLATKGSPDSNGFSTVTDASLLGFATDPYRYPDNLPIIRAKGGPDGKPGCNGLPRPDLNMPIRYLVTDTGFGTGMDLRPNPGIAHPWLLNYFPVTKAVPEPPRIYGAGPPAIGPVPYPGGPPYGARLFGPDGAPLWAPP